jgi:ribonuclease I
MDQARDLLPADSADEYFSRAVALVDQLNASKAQGLFASNVGGEITGKAIRDAFDESFGEGAGDRVRVSWQADSRTEPPRGADDRSRRRNRRRAFAR